LTALGETSSSSAMRTASFPCDPAGLIMLAERSRAGTESVISGPLPPNLRGPDCSLGPVTKPPPVRARPIGRIPGTMR
jgi:hypothetical protein